MSNYRNRKLLDLARGAPCMFNLPDICNYNPETTVACHSNLYEHGKGKNLKAHDCFHALGCFNCHNWYDGRDFIKVDLPLGRPDRFIRAMHDSWLYYWKNGLIRVSW